jgi:hypothetical protein
VNSIQSFFILLICLVSAPAHLLHAQSAIATLESTIAALQEQVGTAVTDAERLKASDKLHETLIGAFELDEVFVHPFPSWSKVGAMRSPDQAFRLFNWNIPKLDGSHEYRCVLLFPDKTYYSLKGKKSPGKAEEDKVINADEWYGALYYYIQPVKHKSETWYTLLGWEGHNLTSNKKVIDVLWFDNKGRPSFGKAVFKHENHTYHRRVFEYNKAAQMTLSYLPAKEAIVYNELVPQSGSSDGNYAFYMPGTAYHGYHLEKELWIHDEKVDMTRPKGDEDKPQFNFPARPDLNKVRSTQNPLSGE